MQALSSRIGGQALWRSVHARIVMALFAVCASLILAHKLGVFEIRKDLMLPGNHIAAREFSGENIAMTKRWDENTLILTCKRTAVPFTPICGVSLHLGDMGLEAGIDLGHYDSVKLGIEVKAANPLSRIRVSFRNFDPTYARVDDPLSLKYNSVLYSPGNFPEGLEAALSSFQVESWWLGQELVSYAHSHLDYSNASMLEISSLGMNAEEEVQLIIKHVILEGQMISFRELVWVLFGTSIFILCVLIAMQHYRLHVASTRDDLTGLINRRGLNEWVYALLGSSDSTLTMFYFDIDDFKKVNDTLGHHCGDELLKAFCQKIKQAIKDKNCGSVTYCFGRIAGDEFVLVFRAITVDQIQTFAQALMRMSDETVELSGGPVKINFSLGVASSDRETKSFDALLNRADAAMYHAKKRGKSQFKIFDESVANAVYSRKKIAERLSQAIQNNEFSLEFMPIVDAQSRQSIGCEVLLRCQSNALRGVGPDTFIPVAEQYNLIQKIDLWVIEHTFKYLSKMNALQSGHNAKFAMNISAKQLHNANFVEEVKRLVEQYHIDTRQVEIEITETSLVQTDDEAIDTLRALKALGFSLSLDDFGTGYTAFNQLINFPVDRLKIDKLFTDKIAGSAPTDVVMVNAILSIARSYGLSVTAEGVEYEHQLEYLNAHGCDNIQGYYFSKPLDFDSFVNYHTMCAPMKGCLGSSE